MNTELTKSAFFSRCLLVALLIPFTFACTGLHIFLANSTEWGGELLTILPLVFGFITLFTILFFLIQLPFLYIKKHWFIFVNSFLFACGFLLWMQANVFNWNFGELDGTGVDWTTFRPMMVLEIAAYFALIGLIFWKREWLHKYVIHLSCLVIFMQSVPLLGPLHLAWKHTGSWQQYEITYDGFFDYSQEQNVVLIIPDTFYSALFQRIVKKHPEVLEWFADFNYFPHQKTQGGTRTTIPQMFTACDAKSHQTKRAATVWNSDGALLKTLTEAGFQTKIYTFAQTKYHWDHHWVSNIRLKDSEHKRTFWEDWQEADVGLFTDLAIVRSVPIVLKPANIESFRWVQHFLPVPAEPENAAFRSLRSMEDTFLVQIIDNMSVSANSEKPVINVIHFRAAHAPFNFNEYFEQELMRDIEAEERQAFAALLLIKRIIDNMKTAGVYDNTHIIIAGDHGQPSLKRITSISNRALYYNPLLLVKRLGERNDKMVVRDEYTNVQDMTPTILNLVGMENQGRQSEVAFSFFDIPADVLAQRREEYEAFWAEKREEWEGRIAKMEKQKTGSSLETLSKVALKRSELVNYHGELCWYVGDNPDVWNKTYSNHEGIIVMTSAETGSCYQDFVRLTMLGSESEWNHYWFCTGKIDVSDVADGEYEVAFLLPQKDGSYTKNVLGKVLVAAGIAEVR